MVPVYVRGFNGLKERIESQKATIASVTKCIEILQAGISEIKGSVQECERMARQCDSKQRILEERMIQVLGKMEAQSSRSPMVVTSEHFIEKMASLHRNITLPTYP